MSLQYLKKKLEMKLIFFYMQKNIKDFFKLKLSFSLCVVKHAQITQNNKFAISLQYHKKEVNDEVDFLHTDKHENFLKIDAMIFDGDGQTFPKFPKLQFAMSLQYLKKEVSDEVDFLHADKHKSFLQVDFNTLSIKVFYKVILSLVMGMIKHSQST